MDRFPNYSDSPRSRSTPQQQQALSYSAKEYDMANVLLNYSNQPSQANDVANVATEVINFFLILCF